VRETVRRARTEREGEQDVSEIDRMLADNERWESGVPGDLPAPPARKVAVVACMDARMPVLELLGLSIGEAHVIRNAGGIVTDDVLRSLAVSQHALGTREVVVVQHTGCGMQSYTDDQVADVVQEATGHPLPWPAGTFADLDDSVRSSVARVREAPFLVSTEVRGTVYDLRTGRLREVQ
jgi:carbonic anhydrase